MGGKVSVGFVVLSVELVTIWSIHIRAQSQRRSTYEAPDDVAWSAMRFSFWERNIAGVNLKGGEDAAVDACHESCCCFLDLKICRPNALAALGSLG